MGIWLFGTFMMTMGIFNTVGWLVLRLSLSLSLCLLLFMRVNNYEINLQTGSMSYNLHPTRRLLACATEFVGVDAALLLSLVSSSSSSSSWLSVSTSGGGTTTRVRVMLVFTARLISARS